MIAREIMPCAKFKRVTKLNDTYLIETHVKRLKSTVADLLSFVCSRLNCNISSNTISFFFFFFFGGGGI